MNDNQPISVAEAIAAVQAAIDVAAKAKPAPWTRDGGVLFTPERMAVWNSDAEFIVAARAGYSATLEYLLEELKEGWMWPAPEFGGPDDPCVIDPDHVCYPAVAPIVEWHRAQGGGR